MATRRTKKQKIKAQHKAMWQSSPSTTDQVPTGSTFKFSAQSLTSTPSPKLAVTDLLMSQPVQIRKDLFKTIVVSIICLICLAIWYWRLKVAAV